MSLCPHACGSDLLIQVYGRLLCWYLYLSLSSPFDVSTVSSAELFSHANNALSDAQVQQARA
jgi:hypothetical protein